MSRDRDAASAAMIAEEAGADALGTAALHDRLLYAMDRGACRDLCREHFDREVEPRPARETESGVSAFGALARPRILLGAVVICGLLVAGAAGLPGSGTPGGDAFVPGEGSGTAGPGEGGVVTPIGGAPGETRTTALPTTVRTPTPTPTPRIGTPPPPPPDEPALLEPCSDGDGFVICVPPRPFSANHDPEITIGSTRTSLSGTFENPYKSDITRAGLYIETPPGWGTRPVVDSPFEILGSILVRIDRLAPGQSGNVSWVVAPPESAEGGRYNVTVVSQWRVPEYDGPEFSGTDTDANYYRVRRNYTYLVKPAPCEGVERCSLLVNDGSGTGPFEQGTPRVGAANTTEGYVHNPYDQPITNGTITLEPPNEAWNVTAMNGTTFGTLGAGESQPVAWNLTVPEGVDCSREYTLTGEATYELDVGAFRPAGVVIIERITVPFSVTVSPEPSEGGECFVLTTSSSGAPWGDPERRALFHPDRLR
jgi:hypothetical protein